MRIVSARGSHVNPTAVQIFAVQCKSVEENFCSQALWHDKALKKSLPRLEVIMQRKIGGNFFAVTILAAAFLLAGISAATARLVARQQATAPAVANQHERDNSQAQRHAG